MPLGDQAPNVGKWYTDMSLSGGDPNGPARLVGARFLVLEVGKETLLVQDEFGERRAVSRLAFERDMKMAKRQPMAV